jgi:hypothetical protein
MLGSISGHVVSHDDKGVAVYADPPQRGDVVDVDAEQAATWVRQHMAEPIEDSPAAVEAAVIDTKPAGRKPAGQEG